MPVAKIKDFTPADLRRIAKALEGYSVELHQLADGMDAEKIERMPIKGVGELERAEERIGVFCDNGRTSLRRVTRPMMFGQAAESGAVEVRREPQPPKKAAKKKLRR